MKRDIDRLLLLLAASGLEEREIYDALRWVERDGVSRVMNRLMAFKRRLRMVGAEEQSGYIPSEERRQQRTADQVSQLLQVEAGLSSTRAVSLMLESLSKSKIRTSELPRFRSKEGFRSWIQRVAVKVPTSELLHHATRVRNAIVHTSGTDWPLRDR